MRSIHFTACQENIITRVNGLFAYIEYDETIGEGVLHSASDSPIGCYGKRVANIRLPFDVEIRDDDGIFKTVFLKYDEDDQPKSYSFSEIMRCYYYLKENREGENEEFIEFIEKGLGRVYVGDILKSGTPRYPYAPEYIKMSSAKVMLNKMLEMRNKCRFYQNHIKEVHPKEWNSYMCCLCDRYEEMNGDLLIKELRKLIERAKDIADEFKEIADMEQTTIDFNIFLSQSIRDMGMVTSAIRIWEAGVMYYPEEVVYYNGDTWKCIEKTSGKLNNETEELEFDEDKWLIQNKKKGENGLQYKGYFQDKEIVEEDEKDTVEYIGGSVLKSLRYKSEYTDVDGYVERPDRDEDWLWYYRLGVIFNDEKTTDAIGNMRFLGKTLEIKRDNETDEGIEDNIDDENIYEVESVYDNTEFKQWDEEHTDKNSMTVDEILGNKTECEKILQILKGIGYDGQVVEDAEREGFYLIEITNLCAYGDSIWNIELGSNKDEESGEKIPDGTIRFIYYTDTHLIASFDLRGYLNDKQKVTFAQQVDEDGAMKYFFKGYRLDVEGYNQLTDEKQEASEYSKKVGLKYDETYTYSYDDTVDNMEIDDISYLVNSEHFQNYIRGYYDLENSNTQPLEEGYMFYIPYRYNKYPFSISRNISLYALPVKNSYVTQPYIRSKVTYYLTSQKNIADAQLIRYEKWMGVTHQPQVSDDIYVERGVTAAFEKHIKFSEIKTMEDMETYANGGFFISEKV